MRRWNKPLHGPWRGPAEIRGDERWVGLSGDGSVVHGCNLDGQIVGSVLVESGFDVDGVGVAELRSPSAVAAEAAAVAAANENAAKESAARAALSSLVARLRGGAPTDPALLTVRDVRMLLRLLLREDA